MNNDHFSITRTTTKAKQRLMRKASSYTQLKLGANNGWVRQRALGTIFCAVLCTCVGVGPAVAQNDEEKGEAQVTLNLQDVDIRVLINTVAEVSGKNFIVDPRVKGKVSVISGATLGPDQLYDVFLSILEVHNFATVEIGNIIKVLPSNVIKQRPTPTLFTPTEDYNDSQITQIIQLEHAAVQDLSAIIRPLIPPSSHFAPHVPSNSLIITDTAANIQRVLLIIRKIDVPDKRSNIRVVPLEHAKASELATALTQLVTASDAPRDAVASGKIIIQPYDSINSLLISALDDEYVKIQALIHELDIERELQSDVNVIRLKHAKAEDLVSILNDVTATSTKGAVSEFSVQADEASNSLVVKASGNQLKSVQGVVDKLDVRRAQVFVETVIAEVSLNQAANLGVTWGAGGPNDTTVTSTDSTTSVTNQVGNIVNRDDPFTPIGTATIASAFNLASGGLTASLEGFKKYNLDVVINALRTDTDSNILSTPTILTLDNESAEIVVGQEVPFITGSFNSGFNNSTTTDNTGNQQVSTGNNFQTIERKDVGIKLKIKPQISDGATIQLEVMQEISSVSTTAVAGQADLITDRRSIEAIVQVDDGQVVVLGGLMVDNVVDTESRVPILGSIPLLGALFRSKGKTAEKRNLMIFLKPRIIRTPDQLAKFSKDKYEDLRRDSEISRLNTSSFMIEDADPAVLVEYDKSTGDGKLRSERQERLDREQKSRGGSPAPKGLRGLFMPKRDDQPVEENDFRMESKNNQSLEEKVEAEMAPGSENRIDWDRPVPTAIEVFPPIITKHLHRQ